MAKSGTVPFYNEVGTKSLRFDEGSSTSLARTPAADGNRRTWTWSAWFKRDQLSSNTQMLFSTSQNAPDEFNILILDGDDRMAVGTAAGALIITSMKFRDFSAWYHVVARMDTTQGTAVNRFKLYINGVETANDTNGVASIISSQDQELGINKAAAHHIGKRQNNSLYFGGYMSDINFVDGTSLGPDSFGEFKNGIWIPIVPDVTYGQNGFRLDFLDNAVDAPTSEGTEDTDNIGSDSSGEHNNWTSVNTVASDCAMPDTPENNFCTINSNASIKGGNFLLSEGSLKMAMSNISGKSQGSFAVSSGKWYWEARQNSSNRFGVGIMNQAGKLVNEDLGPNAGEASFQTNGNRNVGNTTSSYGSSVSSGQVVMVALDMDAKAVYFGSQGTWFNTDGSSDSATVKAQIEAGTTTNAMATGLTGTIVPAAARQTSSNSFSFNFGQDSTFAGEETAASNTDTNENGFFQYAPPSDFLALCTANLPEPTIGANSTSQADDYFEAVLYEGDGSTQNIAVNFQPDWTWIKNRDANDSHQLFDSPRGATNALHTDLTNAEAANDDTLTAFISTGFSLGDDVVVNTDDESYVSWNWKAGGAPTATNDNTSGAMDANSVFVDGSALSFTPDGNTTIYPKKISANRTAGFSIVLYPGDDTATAKVPHGLTQAPEMIIIKNVEEAVSSAPKWPVFHLQNTSAPATDYLDLNSNAGTADDTITWNDVLPSATLVTLGTGAGVNSGSDHIMYCFHSVEGYSKIGSYIGDGSASGPFIFTGFRPAWVIVKESSSSGEDWMIWDNKRAPHNEVFLHFYANNADAEQGTAGGSTRKVDFLSNGFKTTVSHDSTNTSGETYIYMAFAEQPFKYANAR